MQASLRWDRDLRRLGLLDSLQDDGGLSVGTMVENHTNDHKVGAEVLKVSRGRQGSSADSGWRLLLDHSNLRFCSATAKLRYSSCPLKTALAWWSSLIEIGHVSERRLGLVY